jgi:hypothetical protein
MREHRDREGCCGKADWTGHFGSPVSRSALDRVHKDCRFSCSTGMVRTRSNADESLVRVDFAKKK